MKSFHNDASTKEKYLARLRAHRAADEIIQGTGYENGKGCAVGCTLNNYNHEAYETELGIPMILARLEDRIFEGLTVEDSKDFPINFLSAIPVGRDLSNVWKHFMIWLLADPVDGVVQYANTDQIRKAVQDVADLLGKSMLEKITTEQFETVRRAAAYKRMANKLIDILLNI